MTWSPNQLFKDMKRILIAAAAALSLVSCMPQVYTMYLQTRTPSDSGVDMDGKTMAIVYLEDGTSIDSLFNNCLADGLAQGLEKEYFGGETSVDVCSIVTDKQYSSKDSLVRLALDMDVDILFLVDRPQFNEASSQGKLQTKSLLYVYDTMGRDSVYTLHATTNIVSDLASSAFSKGAANMGNAFSTKFINGWKEDSFTVIYYDADKWTKALTYADNLEWDKAAEIWMNLATTCSNPDMKSCAAYDVALACYMNREYDLAMEWLAESDRLAPISDLTKTLRRKIINAKGSF